MGNGGEGRGREEGEVKGRGLVPPHMTCLHDAPAKTGFSVLKKLRVTRFFGFGKNRVGNLRNREEACAHNMYLTQNLLIFLLIITTSAS